MEHELEFSVCPICSHPSGTRKGPYQDHSISKEVFTISECDACNCWYTSPRPVQAELPRYYQSDAYISHTGSKRNLFERIYHLVRTRTLRSKHALIARYEPNGKILDIGCGTGSFLGQMKSKGYLTYGMEPDERARTIASSSSNVVANLEQTKSSAPYSIVTLWHVLEHLPHPSQTLKTIHAITTSNALLVIAVPDRESWDASFFDHHWAAYDVPRHLSHFRQTDIAKLLADHGFNLLSTRRMWYDAIYVSILSAQYKGLPVPFITGFVLGCWSNLVAFLTQRPTSSSLYIARKGRP